MDGHCGRVLTCNLLKDAGCSRGSSEPAQSGKLNLMCY